MGKFCRLLAVILAIGAAGCGLTDATPPPLQGPSELGLSVTLFANPDVLSQDGASQSQIVIEARDAYGQLAPNTPVRVEIVYQGTPVDFGTLSSRTVVTGSNGRATVTYTAPAIVGGTAAGTINIRVTPTGSDAANAIGRVVGIRLVPPGVIGAGGPTPSFTFLPSNPRAFEDVIFSSTSTPAATTNLTAFSWNFGDGSTASGPSAVHRFASGTYLVQLTVTDTNGVSATAIASVSVGTGDVPDASFTISPSTGSQPNDPVFFNASSSTPGVGRRLVRYDWDFGTGDTASGVVVSYSFAQAGTFTVTLTVTDDVGQTAQDINTVTVASAGTGGTGPAALFTFSPTSPGVNQAVFFDGSGSTTPSGTTITSYAWNFGDGGTGTGATASHTFTAAGTYVVRLTVTNSAGQTATATQNVPVTATSGGAPTASFTFSPASPAVGENVFFNSSTSSAGPGHTIAAYAWTFGDGGTSTVANPTHAYTTSGSYAVQLTVTNEIGQSTTSSPTTINVGSPPAPTANFTFSPISPGRNDEVVFDASSSTTAQGQTIVDVAWNFGDGTAVIHCPGGVPADCPGPTNRISAHTFATAQTFAVNLVVTDSANRTASRVVNVIVAAALPNVVITTSPSSPNPGTVVNFNSNGTTYYAGSGPSTFSWTFGDGGSCSTALPAGCGLGTPANPTHTYVAVGSYSAGLSVTDTKGRTGVGNATVTVVAVPPPPSPVAAFTFSPTAPATPPVVVNFDAATSLTPSGAAIVNYRWNFGDGTAVVNVAVPTVPHTYATTGTFTVTLIVTDSNALTGSTTGSVTVIP